MRVGVSLLISNPGDWDRYEARAEAPQGIADHQLFDDTLEIASLVEPLGFDALWSVEHHGSPYLLHPDPLQLLAYYAGMTERLDVGSMVAVLPWHDPVRIAEQIALLDNLLQGRRMLLGFGRGAAQREFDAMRVPMGESRERFAECLEVVRLALSTEWFEYEGTHYQIPLTTVRPRPRSPDLADRMYMAWGSPASLEIAARAELGVLATATRSWEKHAADLDRFNRIRAENGWAPKQPIVCAYVHCDPSSQAAWEAARSHFSIYWDLALRHYAWQDRDDLASKGYEHYADTARQGASKAGTGQGERLIRSQVWGTPSECLDKLLAIRKQTMAEEFVLIFGYGGMPTDMIAESMRLIAHEVLPELHELPPEIDGEPSGNS